jgi:hypothetical protein
MAFIFGKWLSQVRGSKHQIDEEARLEVIEARAFMPRDITLKGAYHLPSISDSEEEKGEDSKVSTTLRGNHVSQKKISLVPLFNPSLNRSRILLYNRTNLRAQHTQISPYTATARASFIESLATPIGLYAKDCIESKASSPRRIMQTRHLKMPPIQMPLPDSKSNLGSDYFICPINPTWYSPTVSIAASSPTPSIYFDHSAKPKVHSLRPAPARKTSPILPSQNSIIKYEQSCLPARASIIATQPTLQMPQRTLAAESRRPSLAELDAVDFNCSVDDRDDQFKIEYWLEGTKNTLSAFGPNIGLNEASVLEDRRWRERS